MRVSVCVLLSSYIGHRNTARKGLGMGGWGVFFPPGWKGRGGGIVSVGNGISILFMSSPVKV